jgi:biopolymer transport protein ExbD
VRHHRAIRFASLLAIIAISFSLYAHTNPNPSPIWISLKIVPSDRAKCIDQHPFLLTLNEDGSVKMNMDAIDVGQVRSVFHELLGPRSDKRVFVKIDRRVRYGYVLTVLDELKSADPDLRIILLTPSLESAPCAPPIPMQRVLPNH